MLYVYASCNNGPGQIKSSCHIVILMNSMFSLVDILRSLKLNPVAYVDVAWVRLISPQFAASFTASSWTGGAIGPEKNTCQLLALVYQKARTNKNSTSSGGEFKYCLWLKSCTSWYGKYHVNIPIIYRVSYIPGGCLGFQPSTVVHPPGVDFGFLPLLFYPNQVHVTHILLPPSIYSSRKKHGTFLPFSSFVIHLLTCKWRQIEMNQQQTTNIAAANMYIYIDRHRCMRSYTYMYLKYVYIQHIDIEIYIETARSCLYIYIYYDYIY